MKKINKLLFFAILVPFVAACDSFMPNFNNRSQPQEDPAPTSSSSKPAETSSVRKTEKFVINWVDWDGDVLMTEKYEKGNWPTYKGLTPSRESENGIDFQFTGWLPEVTEVNEDKSYVAQYMTINSYEEQTSDKVRVKFLNYDGTILLENEYKKGRTPSYYGQTPVRPSEGDIQYTFAGWCPELGPVDVDTNYVATFTSSYAQSKYTVKWVNYDGTTLQESQYKIGETPSYKGITPTRAKEGEFEYTFKGWSPEIQPVRGDTTYVATYSSYYVQSTFKVRWLNYDGSLLSENTCSSGEVPYYVGGAPTKPSDGDIEYKFSGWSPNVGPVYSDVTYVATFTSSYDQSSFTVKFLNWDGTTLSSKVYSKGEIPTFTGGTPVRESDGDIEYTFTGWNPSIEPVSADASYVAVFSSSYDQSTFTVKFLNWDGTVLTSDVYDKGVVPSYNGPTPTRESDGDINYTFNGWNSTLQPVYGDTTYVAVFSSSYVQSTFTIKFVDWDGRTLSEQQCKVDELPTYPFGTPMRSSDGDINYSFVGWNPSVQNVTCDATYVAVYSSSYTQSTFEIRWVNYDGTVLERDFCSSGELPTYDGVDPYKPAEHGNNYVFTGWAPTVAPATSDATYIAQFAMSNENIDYAVTWYDWNGNYLAQDYFKYGSTPEYNYGTPYRDPDTERTYAFVGWEPEISEVTRNTSYKAVFESATRQYEVRWLDANDNLIYSEMVDYGAQLQYQGDAPTRESDTYYHYTFSGWNNDYCYGNTDVRPNFNSTLRQYKVTWANADGSVFKEEMYNAGDWPNFNGDYPTKDPEGAYSYSFSDWYPYRRSVTEDITYTAQFYENTRYVNIQFMDYEGNNIWWNSYIYGTEFNVSFDSGTLSRAVPEGDSNHYYEFIGWDKEVSNIANEDVVYNPVYEERNCIDNLILKLSQDGTHYVVVGYKNIPDCGHIGIPAEYNGLPITEIGLSAFSNCSQIRNVVMTDSITKIGDSAFGWCYSARFVLSKNIQEIGRSAFENDGSIGDIDLPNIETIGINAFAWSWNSSSTIKLGKNLREINENAFVCFGGKFEVDEENQYFTTVDGVLYNKDVTELIAYPYGKSDQSFVVPNSVTKICNYAFRYNENLMNVILPDSLVEIGQGAFYECRQIRSVVIPDSVTILKEEAFSSCQRLASVEISANITEINANAFNNCDALTNVVIPDGITAIRYAAFANCDKLKNITIPSSVTAIYESAFAGCLSLESIEIPSGVTIFYNYIFDSCKNLTSVIINEGVQSIYSGCFGGCVALDEVTLPSTITWISGGAFNGCYYMYTIRFNGTMEQWNAIGKDSNWNENCGVTQIICTDGTINIGD